MPITLTLTDAAIGDLLTLARSVVAQLAPAEVQPPAPAAAVPLFVAPPPPWPADALPVREAARLSGRGYSTLRMWAAAGEIGSWRGLGPHFNNRPLLVSMAEVMGRSARYEVAPPASIIPAPHRRAWCNREHAIRRKDGARTAPYYGHGFVRHALDMFSIAPIIYNKRAAVMLSESEHRAISAMLNAPSTKEQ